MDPHIERLQKGLDYWENLASRGTSVAEASLEFLEAVEDILVSGRQISIEPGLWHRFLNATGRREYLESLANYDQRLRWAKAAFRIIQLSNYSLSDMFEHRVSENPERILFKDISGAASTQWTYEQVARHLKEIAALFHLSVSVEPRVAILSENCVEGACCDLACLIYDIMDTTLNPHFDEILLANIFSRLKINIAVTDTEERLIKLDKVRKSIKEPIEIYLLNPTIPTGGYGEAFIGDKCKQLKKEDIHKALAKRVRRALNRVATIMFTSGSTGEPKGVSFSLYNLVSKRFARAAALPRIGKDETLLCYLPLYHTFGRYLEMLGTIYWSGTYVFAGNPSSDRLFSLFPEINPTGLISVPIRWVQLHERALQKMSLFRDTKRRNEAFRSVVGNRLRWGLSAAGYMNPKVFRFFQGNGVELCSGFGMTEATGGITMTPPGGYIENTLGITLPGIATRIGQDGELEISGHYVARYLDEKGPDDFIPYPESGAKDVWISTGDVFRIRSDGYHEIVDRIKDIYKNSKGQTIAPRRMESKFIGTPGVKRAFMVGEGRAYNVLLIVPDLNDPILKSAPFSKNPREYFDQLVAAANQTLAPYERAVNFALLDRDFETAKGELSLKGTFRRRAIEAHFADQIEALYKKNFVELAYRDFCIRIPLWFFRDLGITEDNIKVCDAGLFNQRTGLSLPIKKDARRSTILVGDLEYKLPGKIIDIELFTRQPRLWIGNPSLVSFCPCKEGWDVPLDNVSPQVFRPLESSKTYSLEEMPELKQIRDPILIIMNKLLSSALYGDKETALLSIEKVGEELREADDRMAEVIWRRLEALSHHPDEDVRCLAYRTLLFDEPSPDFSKAFPTFILSGLSFLNQDSIKSISSMRFEQRRLDALRKRLFTYRMQLAWPVPQSARLQIENVLRLLSEFTHNHPAFYNSVRAELASWAFHKSDRALARTARAILDDLGRWFETKLNLEAPKTSSADWASKLVFEDELARKEVEQIRKVFVGTTFLQQSIILAFDEKTFELKDVAEGGIWIQRIESFSRYPSYRVSVNTRIGKHYSLLLLLPVRGAMRSARESVYLHASIAGYPFGASMLPRLGCYRPDLGAYSSRYLGDLTLWEQMRRYSGTHEAGKVSLDMHGLRKLFIQGLEAFFRGWHRSGRQIVPGMVSPANVTVSELDLHESSRILSLTGWSKYKNGLSLVRPMLRNFYNKILAYYPSYRRELDVRWIFDACVEALGENPAGEFLTQLLDDLERETLESREWKNLPEILTDYCRRLKTEPYVPLPLGNAIEKYLEWERSNPLATAAMKEQTIIDLYNAYHLDRFPGIVRYYLYRRTYFSQAEVPIISAFDKFLSEMRKDHQKPAVQLASLSDLHLSLTCSNDRSVFSRMIFPQVHSRRKVDILKVSELASEQVTLHTCITDKHGEQYICREAIEPVEIGELYRLFFLEDQPVHVAARTQHLIVIDSQEEIIGGICYKISGEDVAEIEGIIIVSPLKERGIETAILEDFCARMVGRGIRVIKTPFVSRNFFLQCGFSSDRRWSGLVKLLSPERF